jgi:hypothetical protein
VKILLRRRDVDPLTGPAAIRVRRSMKRLMYVAHEMDQEGEVAGGTPFIVIAVAKTTSILIDFRRDAISAWAPRWQIVLVILKANIDVMPGCRGPIFLAELGVGPN